MHIKWRNRRLFFADLSQFSILISIRMTGIFMHNFPFTRYVITLKIKKAIDSPQTVSVCLFFAIRALSSSAATFLSLHRDRCRCSKSESTSHVRELRRCGWPSLWSPKTITCAITIVRYMSNEKRKLITRKKGGKREESRRLSTIGNVFVEVLKMHSENPFFPVPSIFLYVKNIFYNFRSSLPGPKSTKTTFFLWNTSAALSFPLRSSLIPPSLSLSCLFLQIFIPVRICGGIIRYLCREPGRPLSPRT